MKKTIEIPEFLKDKYKHGGWQDGKIALPNDKIFLIAVTIMRANPPHINHTAMLRELCRKAMYVRINIGSSNKFDRKNPFKAEEREEMLDLALKDEFNNYELVFLPDFDDDERWFQYLVKHNKNFTEILSNNDYDLKIYQAHQFKTENGNKHRLYDILHPVDIIDQDKMEYVDGVWQDGLFVQTNKPLYVSGTFVRAAIVNNWGWQNFVDEPVAEYIKQNNLVERIKKYCPELKRMALEEFETGR
ncbi:hypothetical protein HZA33_04725 [Candidatus Pacearchaeota archaeon]|nr:hypothetical protein [Candidatus Pacearchaeota archaeon]